MTRLNGPAGPPGQKEGPAGWSRLGAETTEAANLSTDSSTRANRLHSDIWLVPMRLAYRIGRTPTPWKIPAVRDWRLAVVDALVQEVRA